MEQKKKVRLSDIAEKLNVSIVTVSKALADKDGVGDELKQKIKSLAESMGYILKKDSGKSASEGTILFLLYNLYYNSFEIFFSRLFFLLVFSQLSFKGTFKPKLLYNYGIAFGRK